MRSWIGRADRPGGGRHRACHEHLEPAARAILPVDHGRQLVQMAEVLGDGERPAEAAFGVAGHLAKRDALFGERALVIRDGLGRHRGRVAAVPGGPLDIDARVRRARVPADRELRAHGALFGTDRQDARARGLLTLGQGSG